MPSRWLWVTPAAKAAALSLSGCSSGSGVIQGHVLVFSPVPTPPGSTATTTLPIARFTSTVEAKRGGRVVARERIPPGRQFRFTLPSGPYDLTAFGAYNCGASATVSAGETENVDVRCVEP